MVHECRVVLRVRGYLGPAREFGHEGTLSFSAFSGSCKCLFDQQSDMEDGDRVGLRIFNARLPNHGGRVIFDLETQNRFLADDIPSLPGFWS